MIACLLIYFGVMLIAHKGKHSYRLKQIEYGFYTVKKQYWYFPFKEFDLEFITVYRSEYEARRAIERDQRGY